MRRIAVFAILAFSVVITLFAFATAAALRIFEAIGITGPWIFVGFIAAGVLTAMAAGRGIRRYATPLADVVAAAGRVAEGDLGTRVEERGAREMRQLARAFNTMSARLAASEEQRRRLLADVGHELRTPLTVVQGNLEALIDGVRPADADHLRAILDETKVVARLVDDLATLSGAEAGSLPLHLAPPDVVAVARDTAESFAAQASAGGVRLRVDADDDVPAAHADPVRVREIFSNLVTNALRYTPAGGDVRIAVLRDGERIRATVADTGRGVAPESLDRIFDRFYKSADSHGAGLGLAIAKRLVEAQGGVIGATSTLGKGTDVTFTLPVTTPA